MSYEIEEIARLLSVLPPAPTGWVEAAQRLPQLRAGIDELVARAEQDAEVRKRLVADLEAAFAEVGLEPSPSALDEARRRLGA
ncbi:MAG TPA: hypothetical protein VFA97_13305 [Gaiellaceae bacterium]|nr:hypothetical protein [Gaiellaceae bacterium]